MLGRQGLPQCRWHGPHLVLGSVGTLSIRQQAVIRSHAKIRAFVEQVVTTPKPWQLLRKLRCSTTRITSLVQAILTLRPTRSDR